MENSTSLRRRTSKVIADAKQGYAVAQWAISACLAVKVALMITKLWGIIAESPAHPCLASAITFDALLRIRN
jgi:hypothetical protein